MMIKSGMGLAMAGIAIVVFAIGAVWIVLRLLRSNREAIIATLPVVSEQTAAIKVPGELVVSIEVPRLATDYRQWELEVVEDSTRQLHAMKYSGLRATGTVKGFSTIKVPLGRLTLSRPDKLTLRVSGLAREGNYAAYHLVLTRPYLARMAIQIVGLVVCGVGMMLSLIWGLWLMGVVKPS